MPSHRAKQRSALQEQNEELAAGQIEIEAVNSELRSLNQQIQHRNSVLQHRGDFAAGVIDAISVPTLVLDRTLRVLEANRAFNERFQAAPAGWPLARLGGGGWDNKQLLRALRRTLRQGTALVGFEMETALDGAAPRTLAVSATRVNGGGHAPTLVCCLEDVTDRRHAEGLLRTRAEQLSSTASGVLLLDEKQRVTFANPAASAMLGYASDELIGRHIHNKVHASRPDGSYYPRGDCPMLACLRRQSSGAGEEMLRRKNGTFVPVHWDISPQAGGGAVVEVRVTSADKRMLAALLESEKLAATGKIAATLAHEINNPLGAVSNAIYVLQSLLPEQDGRARAMVNVASSELARVNRIVKSTLGLYRESQEPVAVDVNQACASALELLRGQIEAKHLQVRRRLRATHPLRMQPGDLRQVLANLIGNAIEAAPAGGLVWCATADCGEPDRPGVRLMVGDNGPGIPDEVRQRIFQPFFTTKGNRGTGLGLWVVAEIAHRYGASIRLKTFTRSPTGTCFSVAFPAA